jgi:signal transduction histidine kinase
VVILTAKIEENDKVLGLELGADEKDGNVQIHVKDNDQGILVEDLPHIFDRFYRGDKSRQHSGESGLGLAIVKSLVEAHGGRISVDSTPGEGAEFTITRPPLAHSTR